MSIDQKLDGLAYLFVEYEILEDHQKSLIRKINKILKDLQDSDYMPYDEIVYHVSVRVIGGMENEN